MNLGERIYELRCKARLSQGDLADSLQVSRQAVSKWENNSAVPELDKLLKMSELFCVSIDELVKGSVQSKTQENENTEIIEESVPLENISSENIAPEIKENRGFPERKIVGLMFFGITLLIAVLSLFFGEIDGLTFCVPFLGLGLICRFSKNYTGLNCLWFLYILFEVYSTLMSGLNFTVYTIRLGLNDIRYLIIGLLALAVNIFLIVFTSVRLKDKPVKKPSRAKIGIIALWSSLVLFYLITIPVGPFLVDSVVIAGQSGEALGVPVQLFSLAQTVIPLILFTLAVSFTVRYRKLKKV